MHKNRCLIYISTLIASFILSCPKNIHTQSLTLTSIQKKKYRDKNIYQKHFHEMTYLVAHNAFASSAYGYTLKQQSKSIAELLNLGIRGFMLDTEKVSWSGLNPFNAQEKSTVALCHGSCEVNWLQQPFRFPDNLWERLLEIRSWMEQNPEEIVVIILQNRVKNLNLLENHIKSVFRADIEKPEKPDEDLYINNGQRYKDKPVKLIFTPKDLRNWHQESKESSWPTLQWMIKNNKRLIIFNSDNQDTSLLFNEWAYHAENMYGTIDFKEAVAQRWESYQRGKNNTRHLLLANYFPNTIRIEDFTKVNNKNLNAFIFNCFVPAWGYRMPNFIAVDEAHLGSPVNIVRKINSYISTESLCKYFYKPIPTEFKPNLS